MFKSITFAALILLTSNALAYQADQNCPHMVSAHRGLYTAGLQPEVTSELKTEFESIQALVYSGLVYGRCDLSEIKTKIGNVILDIRTSGTLRVCTQDTITAKLSADATTNLSVAGNKFGGYAFKAYVRSAVVSTLLQQALDADTSCHND